MVVFYETIVFHGTKAVFDRVLADMAAKGYTFWGTIDNPDGPGKLLIFKKG